MKIEIMVKRQKSPEEKPYIQSFVYTGDGNLTIADWLSEINCTEAKLDRIAWDCGCMEKKCGGCAMLINGVPALACGVFLKDTVRKGKITLEPFKKFPLVKDLIVDRRVMFETLKEMKIWTGEKNDSSHLWNLDLQYKAGQCLQCGCCLEVCPNFMAGDFFAGAAAMVSAYKAVEQNKHDEHHDEMKKAYRKEFFNYCGQSLSCKTVCPKKLPLDEIQARINGHK